MASIELVSSEEVLASVKSHGPVQPLEIRGILKRGDSIVIGAALSELSSRKLVKVTNVKRGGSPYYYVEGQEPKLESLSKFLNDKDKVTFEFLKEKKVLRDSKQEPLTRVSLRQIKDFAKSFTVKVNQEEEIFWRYYLISEKDAFDRVRGMFKPKEKPAEKKEEPQIEKPKEKAPERKQEEQTSIPETQDFLTDVEDDFLKRLKRFFRDKEIKVKDAKLVRKGSDYEFVIEMNTSMGRAEYYCKAKGKKKCNDGDLSSAYLQGQMKRLPVVFITTGEVAKKAREKVSTDYKGMILKEI